MILLTHSYTQLYSPPPTSMMGSRSRCTPSLDTPPDTTRPELGSTILSICG